MFDFGGNKMAGDLWQNRDDAAIRGNRYFFDPLVMVLNKLDMR